MSLFDIDYDLLVKLLTPRQLRNTKMLAWLRILVSPVKYLYDLFTNKRKENLYTLEHSPQVCYMQAVLNDVFDDALRRIKVIDGPDYEPIYIYREDELKPASLYMESESSPIPLYTNNETVTLGYDFIVQVPLSTTLNETYMKALIDKYRLTSKNNYLIERI